MQKLSSTTTPARISPLQLTLAVYQLAGGLLGLGLFLKLLPALQNPTASTWIGILLAALLYTYSLFCGFLLLKRSRRAYTMSLVNQVLQVIGFGVPGFAYTYVAGFKLGVGIDFMESWLFKFRLSLSSFHFSVGTEGAVSFVSVNLLALLLIYLLERGREETSEL